MAPPFEFIQQAFLPLLERMGPRVTAQLERPGFYPAGGGCMTIEIEPVGRLEPLYLIERGAILERQAIALRAGLPGHVAQRELDTVSELLGWSDDCLQHRQVPAKYGPGNCLFIMLRSEQITEVFTGFGERGVPAETVARRCAREAQRYLAAGVAAGGHLTDQLLLPLALAGGGEFLGLAPSRHTTTNIEVIEQFLPVRIVVEAEAKDSYRFRVSSLKTNERLR